MPPPYEVWKHAKQWYFVPKFVSFWGELVGLGWGGGGGGGGSGCFEGKAPNPPPPPPPLTYPLLDETHLLWVAVRSGIWNAPPPPPPTEIST